MREDSKLSESSFAEQTQCDPNQAAGGTSNEASVLEFVINTIPYAVFWKDLNSVYLGCNDNFAQLCGKSKPADVIGKTDFDFLSTPEEADHYRRCDRKIMTEGVPELNIEETHTGPDDSRRVMLTSKLPMKRPGGEVYGILGIGRDITEQKRVEWALADAKAVAEKALSELRNAHVELQQKQGELIQSSKMASLGEMAGGLAHEINSPLAIIKGKAQQTLNLLEIGQATPDFLQRSFKVIDSTVDRIAVIIQGLRNFARESERDPLVQVDAHGLIRETLSFCGERLRNHSIRIYQDPPIVPILVHCRSVQICQVLLNLLNNAFDAVSNFEQKEKWVRLTVERLPRGVEFSMTDSGPGIPRELRPKIMQPFFTTKPVGQGTGLGLSISRGIIEAHSGRFYLDETSERTRFVVWLPALDGPELD